MSTFRILVLSSMFCMAAFHLAAQPTTFQKTYNTTNGETAFDVLETVDGYLVAGTQFDGGIERAVGALFRLDKAGKIIWQKTYPGAVGAAGFYHIAAANDGGYITWGVLDPVGNGDTDAWLMKVNGSGNIVWQKRIGEPGEKEMGTGKIIPVPGGYLLSGAQTKSGESQTFILRVDNKGVVQWNRRTANATTTTLDMQYATDSLVYLAGETDRLGAWCTLDPATGAIKKTGKYRPDSLGVFYNLHRTPANEQLFSGKIYEKYRCPGIKFPTCGWLQKTTPDGQVIWSKKYKIGDGCSISCSALLPDGTCILGVSFHPTAVVSTMYSALVGIDTSGAVLWARFLGGSEYSILQTILPTTDGGFITVGTSFHATGQNSPGMYVYKADALGLVDGCCIPNIPVWVESGTSALLPATIADAPFAPVEQPADAYDDAGFLVTKDFCSQGQSVTLKKTYCFCAGDSITIDNSTYSQPGLIPLSLPADTGNCSTPYAYDLLHLPQPGIERTISFCPGETVTLGGTVYSQPGTVTLSLPSQTGGCDTLATYQLVERSRPVLEQTISFCPGETVTLGGTVYSQPGTVTLELPSQTGGCDTLATYQLVERSRPVLEQTISFCAGETVTLGGTVYSQPGTVTLSLPSQTGGCDTLATYQLVERSRPVLEQTISFCAGETVTLGGTVYSQPGTVTLSLPSQTGGCDTLATYHLVYASTNFSSSVQLSCPADQLISVAPGTSSVAVLYNAPLAASDCPCPDLNLSLQSGQASGSLFPTGTTTVCYRAEDDCGATRSCCFSIQVTEEDEVCDSKTIGCLKAELLSVNRDAGKNWVYRVRLTNTCNTDLRYAYLEIPGSFEAIEPLANSLYTAPGGHAYTLRSPNYTPFYSLRFKAVGTGLANGQSDIFRYVLPAQVGVDYIHTAIRLSSGAYYEAYLNTFACPVGIEPLQEPAVDRAAGAGRDASLVLHAFPNPAAPGDFLSIEGADVTGGDFELYDLTGRVVLQRKILNNQVLLDGIAPASGLYLFRIRINGAFAGAGKLMVAGRERR